MVCWSSKSKKVASKKAASKASKVINGSPQDGAAAPRAKAVRYEAVPLLLPIDTTETQPQTWKQQNKAYLARLFRDFEYLENSKWQTLMSVTASGLQIQVLESSKDSHRPVNADENPLVKCTGWLVNDMEIFDGEGESWLENCIPGYSEAVKMMKEGDKWRVVVPAELAYGEKGCNPYTAESGWVIPPEMFASEMDGGGEMPFVVPSTQKELKTAVNKWLADKSNDTAYFAANKGINKSHHERIQNLADAKNYREAWDLTWVIPPNSVLILELEIPKPDAELPHA